MKKPLLLSLMVLALASCRAYIPGVVSSTSEKSFSYISSSSSKESSEPESSTPESEQSSDSEPEESSESEEPLSSESSPSSSPASSEPSSGSSEWSPDYEGTTSFVVWASSFPSSAGNYSDGNYGDFTKNGQEFEYYRVNLNGSGEDAYVNLLPASSVSSLEAGSFYNISAFGAIDFLEISYSLPNGSGLVKFGDGAVLESSDVLPKSVSAKTAIIDTKNSNYFKISAGDAGTLTLYSVTIHYYYSLAGNYPQTQMSAPDCRINPMVFSGTLIPGESQVTVPVDINQTETAYSPNAHKTYTYYTYDYVSEHPSVAEDACLTDPVDVANYYIAFGEAPANYLTYNTGTKQVERKSGDSSLFGFNNLRTVSQYSSSSGYATAVPHRGNIYYELDIKVPGKTYSINSRQSGRLVIWQTGFTCYGNYPAVVLTHDHYATFREYLNWGEFGQAFSAERKQTPYLHTPAKTLQPS